MKQLTLLYLIRGNEVLLAMKKRGFGMGKWNGIGGKVEPNETIEQAMIRECREEIGVTPLDYKQAGNMVFDEIFGDNREQVQITAYICQRWRGNPIETEEMAPAWHDINKLPLDTMWSADTIWLPVMLAGNTITGRFTLNEAEKVTDHQLNQTGLWQ